MQIKSEAEFVHALDHRNHFLSLLGMAKEVFKSDLLKVVGYLFYCNIYGLIAFTVSRMIKQYNAINKVLKRQINQYFWCASLTTRPNVRNFLNYIY
jgi:hypothetical protein